MRLRIITLAALGLAGYLVIPFVASGRPDEPLPPTLAEIQLSQCEVDIFDFGLNGRPIDPPAGNAVDLRGLERIDLKFWDTGRFITQADYGKGLDMRKVTITTSAAGFGLNYDFARLPQALPGSWVGAIFDLPDRSSGFRNNYTGPDFEWDVGIGATWMGPGQWSLRGGPYGQERPITGTVVESGNRVTITLPLRTVQELGLATPGLRMLNGTYGPMPERIYDKVPDRGSIQLGLVERGQAVSGRVVTGVDLNNDRRDDLMFINATGGDEVQGIWFDRNNNRQLDFFSMEGPALLRIGTSYVGFGRPQRSGEGRRQILTLENPNLLYRMIAEDRNGDGDFLDAGETEGVFIPRNPTFWGF